MKYFKRNKNYKYELAEDVSFPVPAEIGTALSPFILQGMGAITIKGGYAWDGSSVPLKRLVKFMTFGRCDLDRYCKQASLVHDAFYQLMRSRLLPRPYKAGIDRLYEKMCIAGGMGKREAAARYWAVKTFGYRTLAPRYYPEKTILETN